MAFLPTSYADPREAFFAPLRAIGLQPHQLTGIDWNVQDESGWNPGINEAAPRSGRGGFGLYQLTGPRRKAYEAWAKQNGYALSNPYAQGLYAAHELQTTERKAYEKLLRAGNEGEAASIFASEFLRPAAEHLNARIAKYTGGEMPKGGATMSSRGGGGTFGLMSADAEDLLFPVEDYKRTTGDRIRGGLVGAGELLTALGAGHGTNFAATDAFIQGQRDRGALGNTLNARNKAIREAQLGVGAGGADVNATLGWLSQHGHQDLVDLVSTGGLSAKDAVTEALQRDPSEFGPQPVDPNAPELNEDQMKMATTLRGEATKAFQPYDEVTRAFTAMVNAAQQDSGAGDLSLATGFMKMLDPGSVVRESELALSLNAGGYLDRLIATAKGQVDKGQRMEPEVRQQVLEVGKKLYDYERQKAEGLADYYGDLATRQKIPTEFVFRGLGEALGIPNLTGETAPAAAPEGAPAPAVAPPATVAPPTGAPASAPAPGPGGVLTFDALPNDQRTAIVDALSQPGPQAQAAALDALQEQYGWSDEQADVIFDFLAKSGMGGF